MQDINIMYLLYLGIIQKIKKIKNLQIDPTPRLLCL